MKNRKVARDTAAKTTRQRKHNTNQTLEQMEMVEQQYPIHQHNNQRHTYQQNQATVIRLNKSYKKVEMLPRNTAQENLVDQLMDDTNRIVVASGSAGTGKSYLSTLMAIKSLKEGKITKIIITRPMVEVENEKVGFLPGGISEKMDPWVRPIFDIFEEFYSKQDISKMVLDGVIEVIPLAFMRGRSLKNSFIILDEGQNATPNQMLMLLTRIAEGSRVVITGDIKQTDRPGPRNGLLDLINKLTEAPRSGMAYTIFDKSHVERDEIVQEVLELYNEI